VDTCGCTVRNPKLKVSFSGASSVESSLKAPWIFKRKSPVGFWINLKSKDNRIL